MLTISFSIYHPWKAKYCCSPGMRSFTKNLVSLRVTGIANYLSIETSQENLQMFSTLADKIKLLRQKIVISWRISIILWSSSSNQFVTLWLFYFSLFTSGSKLKSLLSLWPVLLSQHWKLPEYLDTVFQEDDFYEWVNHQSWEPSLKKFRLSCMC